MTPRPAAKDWLRPGLLGLHAFAVIAIAFCILMGLWQMGAYDSRQEHERADKQDVPVVAFSSLEWGPDDAFEGRLNHRPVIVSGVFGPAEEQFWVSGKKQGSATGYWLVAPFLVDGGNDALLIVRGWSAEAGALPAAAEVTEIEAVLEPGEGSGAPLDSNRVTGALRIPALLNVLPYDLYSAFGISSSDAATGDLALATPPKPDTSWTTGMRNLMYALQWWVFGLFALFMWWRMATEAVKAEGRKVA